MSLRGFHATPVTIEVTEDDDPPDDFANASGLGMCGRCDARWHGHRICHCGTCHLTFTSIGGFDDHRTGSHINATRHCRTEDEIRSRGYEPNDAGQWRKPLDESLTHWEET